MLIITETRVGGVRGAKIIEELPFDGFFATETVGYASGLWLLWKKEEVEVFVLSATEQEIHATVKSSMRSSMERINLGEDGLILTKPLTLKSVWIIVISLTLGFLGLNLPGLIQDKYQT
nr:hypothetical protein CFP56_34235 [Quercus suber]